MMGHPVVATLANMAMNTGQPVPTHLPPSLGLVVLGIGQLVMILALYNLIARYTVTHKHMLYIVKEPIR